MYMYVCMCCVMFVVECYKTRVGGLQGIHIHTHTYSYCTRAIEWMREWTSLLGDETHWMVGFIVYFPAILLLFAQFVYKVTQRGGSYHMILVRIQKSISQHAYMCGVKAACSTIKAHVLFLISYTLAAICYTIYIIWIRENSTS